MKERVVYLNGALVPESQAVISVFDRGVQYGDAVYDAARTFGGRPFKLREHIDRLYRSCSYTRMPLRLHADEMEKQTREVLEHNLSLLAPAAWSRPPPGGPRPSASTRGRRSPTG